MQKKPRPPHRRLQKKPQPQEAVSAAKAQAAEVEKAGQAAGEQKAETGAKLPKEAVPEGHDGGTLAKETEPTQMGVPVDVIQVGDFEKTISLSSQWGTCRGRVIREPPKTFKMLCRRVRRKTMIIRFLRRW